MTLTTHVVIQQPLGVRSVFNHCRKLIGADNDRYVFEHHTEPRGGWDDPKFFNPSYRAQSGQGYPALLWIYYGPDGPLRRGKYEHLGIEEDRPGGFIEVSFDTTYGYHRGSTNGAGCEDLHAWLVRELGCWLDERGVSWTWQNEYTGEWFLGFDGLAVFGDADRGALASHV